MHVSAGQKDGREGIVDNDVENADGDLRFRLQPHLQVLPFFADAKDVFQHLHAKTAPQRTGRMGIGFELTPYEIGLGLPRNFGDQIAATSYDVTECNNPVHQAYLPFLVRQVGHLLLLLEFGRPLAKQLHGLFVFDERLN